MAPGKTIDRGNSVKEAEEVYERLQSMYELMRQDCDTAELENAIFEYEDCVSEEDFAAWLEKYSFYR